MNNTFADNTAVSGGAFSIEINYNTSSGSDSIVNDGYYNNTAQQAAALYVAARNLNISKTNFSNNRLQESLHGSGAAFEVRNAIVRIHDCTLTGNQGSDRAIVINNVQLFSRDLKLYKNTGSLYAVTSMLGFSGKSKFINNTLKNNGGAIQALQSSIQFIHTATVEIRGNRASIGGGIYLFETPLNISCKISITDNTAKHMGEGIYAHRSEVTLKREGQNITINNNKAQIGGGAALIASTLNVGQGTVIFSNNTAHQSGGAVYMEQTSALYMHFTTTSTVELNPKLHLIFGEMRVHNNSTKYGGGLYVDDETSGHRLCQNKYASDAHVQVLECFIQGIAEIYLYNHINTTVHFVFFVNNTAHVEGNDIYGGLLERCTVNPHACMLQFNHSKSGLHYINTMDMFNEKYGLNLT